MRSYPELSERELRTRLGRIAAEHQPDRTAMLNRIAQHRPGSPVADRPRLGQAWRLAGSALAVATILGVGGVARWALADGPAPTVEPVAPPAATRAAPTTAPTTPAPPPAAPTVTPSPKASPSQTQGKDGAGKGQPALWTDGSVAAESGDTAGRSEITVKVREPVSALELTVRVALTPGLTDQGAVHDVTGARIDTTVVREGDALVYRFELAGGTLAEGTYVFAAKYAHDGGGRDAGDDTYRVRATTADRGTELDLRGDFY